MKTTLFAFAAIAAIVGFAAAEQAPTQQGESYYLVQDQETGEVMKMPASQIQAQAGAQAQVEDPIAALESALGTMLPIPTNNPAVSALAVSIINDQIPTGAAAQSTFFSQIAEAVPTGSAERSSFIASVTSNIVQATDIDSFESRVSDVFAEMTGNVTTSTATATSTAVVSTATSGVPDVSSSTASATTTELVSATSTAANPTATNAAGVNRPQDKVAAAVVAVGVAVAAFLV
ncbi:hypothetical protein FPQ18DRAFT_305451 [Pyronema domesticum]|uniref:Uncharacterized protein n=1 Tax=Pyronema omphalodes (strain CBS 100304) TaxID=1076935 RepID=U4LTN9_PYROM|nr:hypothetical protein FPQ18DRAFT_305451 [Pyronema domesticum]CCX30951.1 Protein of unknown function [Pyronema omphalodes CBS 100304]